MTQLAEAVQSMPLHMPYAAKPACFVAAIHSLHNTVPLDRRPAPLLTPSANRLLPNGGGQDTTNSPQMQKGWYKANFLRQVVHWAKSANNAIRLAASGLQRLPPLLPIHHSHMGRAMPKAAIIRLLFLKACYTSPSSSFPACSNARQTAAHASASAPQAMTYSFTFGSVPEGRIIKAEPPCNS